MKKRWKLLIGLAVVVLAIVVYYAVTAPKKPEFRADCGKGSGKVVDEAVCAYRTSDGYEKPKGNTTDAQILADKWRAADDDYYVDMDRGATKDPAKLAADLAPFVTLTPEKAHREAVIGRNNWIVWTAGNDRFWDQLAGQSFGNVDMLKAVSSAPRTRFGRFNRWTYLGLVNEPCYRQMTESNEDTKIRRERFFGLYLDIRDPTYNDPACAGPDPFENEAKYPGVALGARGKTPDFPVGSLYGYSTGVIGLRLFPNPDFDEAARKKWDWFRYYYDPTYFNDRNLIRPFRVGMSCAFCHVGPDPTGEKPTEFIDVDQQEPKWKFAHLNSNPGAQYFWIDRIFGFHQDRSNYIFQLYHTSRPGALDTSLVSSDFINNPRTMNAIYSLGPRVVMSTRWGQEKLTGGEQDNKQISEYYNSPVFNSLYKKPDMVHTPRVLKDGADSTGVMGSLNRVYINIGLFSDEWTTHFNPVIGGTGISPIRIKTGRKNSAYWLENEQQTPGLALFFLATAKPDYLANAPGGSAAIAEVSAGANVANGKTVFAENCAACHSSKLPEAAYRDHFKYDQCTSPTDKSKNYIACWDKYWQYANTEAFKAEMRQIVAQPDFLENNFLSTDQRVPSGMIQTNVCSPIGTNALRNNIWDDFSSTTYKELPSAGKVGIHDPYSGKLTRQWQLPADGRGYTRPASLISLWSTAPYLQNNSVGPFDTQPYVPNRMGVFKASIEQMLWPEKREGNVTFRTASGHDLPGRVDVTTEVSYLRLAKGYLPRFVADLLGWFAGTHFVSDEGGLLIGPIPAGTPVNLISNLDLDIQEGFFNEVGHVFKLLGAVTRMTWALSQIDENTPPGEATATFRKAAPALIGVSKCPDYIVNRGHYFGTQYAQAYAGVQTKALTDQEKKDLIAFLVTF